MAEPSAEMVDLDLMAMTASMHTAKTDFSHVTFSDVADTYTAGRDIALNYTIGPELEVSSRDWIGLYQVGWRSTDNYKCYEWSPVPANRVAGKESENHVIFPATKLPDDDGEFYQFCYLTSKGQVRGLSSPFQFRKCSSFASSLDDLIEIEDENGELLIIKSKTVYLDEQLKKANEKCSLLNQDIQLLESEKDLLVLSKQDSERKVATLTEEIVVQKKQIVKLNECVTKLSTEVSSLKTNIKQITEANDTVSKEKSETETKLVECKSRLADLQSERKVLLNEKDGLLGQITALEEEKALYQTHFTSKESAIQAHKQRIDELQSQLTVAQANILKITDECDALESKLTEQSIQLEQRLADHEKQQEVIKTLETLLSEADIEISVREKRELELKDGILAAVEAHQKISSDLELSKTENDVLKGQLESTRLAQAKEREDFIHQLQGAADCESKERKEKERLMEEMVDMSRQLEEAEAHAGADSALYALQSAHSVLKERYLKLDKNVARQQALLDQSLKRERDMQVNVTELHQSISDYKNRLLMGKEEYKVKVVECLRLQDSLRAVQKAGSASDAGSPTDTECSMIPRMQLQMHEAAEELECRGARLREVEERCAAEHELRRAAEQKSRDMENELNSVKDVLARSAVAAPPPTMSEPLIPLPAPLTPQRLYPALGHQSTSETSCMIVRPPPLTVNIDPPNTSQAVGAEAASINIDSPPSSPGDVLPKCPVCDCEFTAQTSADYISVHIDMHYVGDICPVCGKKFLPKSDDYAPHVQSHFPPTQ